MNEYDILERHSYKKCSSGWEIIKTQTLRYKRIPYTIDSILEYSEKMRNYLTPDLLTKKYKKENEINPMYGHCYHATQAMFYLLNTDKLHPMSGADWRNDIHWWLRDKDTGFIVDMTADQYYSIGKIPPHNKGKVSKWYGWKNRPHKRTLILIERLQPKVATITESTFQTVH